MTNLNKAQRTTFLNAFCKDLHDDFDTEFVADVLEMDGNDDETVWAAHEGARNYLEAMTAAITSPEKTGILVITRDLFNALGTLTALFETETGVVVNLEEYLATRPADEVA